MSSKVLICIYEIEDIGGIINWTEHLTHGFKSLGIEVKLVRVEDKEKCIEHHTKRKNLAVSYTGMQYDQYSGWAFPKTNRIPIRSTNWVEYTSNFDLVIWAVTVPTAKKLPKDWQRLYQIHTPQIMVVHDGNINKMWPHAYEVMGNCAVVCVHDCAYNSVNHHNKVLIPNPQVLERMVEPSLVGRKNQLLSLQTFKRWKRVDDLIRAIPHMKNCHAVVAGGGLEMSYMTSTTKRKLVYGDMWERALEAGMEWLGYINEDVRDQRLLESKLLVDPSWSKSYAKYGSHFNRTFVDAIIMGCMPSGRDMLMDGNRFFDKSLYVTIPWDCDKHKFAEICDEVMDLDEKTYVERLRCMQDVVRKNFDSVEVARAYWNIHHGVGSRWLL